jgi:hypothetical protein
MSIRLRTGGSGREGLLLKQAVRKCRRVPWESRRSAVLSKRLALSEMFRGTFFVGVRSAASGRLQPESGGHPAWVWLASIAQAFHRRAFVKACSHYSERGDGGHFAVRQGAESAVYSLYIGELQHRRGPGKRRMIWPRPFGLHPKAGHSALLVVRSESLNVSPRALPGPLWGGNATIRIV